MEKLEIKDVEKYTGTVDMSKVVKSIIKKGKSPKNKKTKTKKVT
jgi:ribosome maturation protein Sdo1